MRTTLTLDADNAERLRELACLSKAPFKRVLNQVLRQGLDAERIREVEPPYHVQVSAMGLRSGIDPLRLSHFDAELDVAAFQQVSQHKRRGKPRP